MADKHRVLTALHHVLIKGIAETINNLGQEMKSIVEEQTKMKIGIGIGGLIVGVGVTLGAVSLMRKRS